MWTAAASFPRQSLWKAGSLFCPERLVATFDRKLMDRLVVDSFLRGSLIVSHKVAKKTPLVLRWRSGVPSSTRSYECQGPPSQCGSQAHPPTSKHGSAQTPAENFPLG